MTKVTVLYGHPADSDGFEDYYAKIHLPLALTIPGVRIETTKFSDGQDGTRPAFYRMAELYADTPGEMQKAFDTSEGKMTTADLANFATGGVTFLMGTVE